MGRIPQHTLNVINFVRLLSGILLRTVSIYKLFYDDDNDKHFLQQVVREGGERYRRYFIKCTNILFFKNTEGKEKFKG